MKENLEKMTALKGGRKDMRGRKQKKENTRKRRGTKGRQRNRGPLYLGFNFSNGATITVVSAGGASNVSLALFSSLFVSLFLITPTLIYTREPGWQAWKADSSPIDPSVAIMTFFFFFYPCVCVSLLDAAVVWVSACAIPLARLWVETAWSIPVLPSGTEVPRG